MRGKLIAGLIVLNVLLAAAIFAAPAVTQIVPMGLTNCCKFDLEPDGYCCAACCWWTWDCREDMDCQDPWHEYYGPTPAGGESGEITGQ